MVVDEGVRLCAGVPHRLSVRSIAAPHAVERRRDGVWAGDNPQTHLLQSVAGGPGNHIGGFGRFGE
jgi:hypothetical protein